MKQLFRLSTAFLIFSFSSSASFADVVVFKNGRNLRGTVVEENKEKVVLEEPAGKIDLPASDIKWVIKGSDQYIQSQISTAIAFKKGMTFQEKGKYSEAIESYQEALNESPGEPSILNNLGVAYAQSEKFIEAIPPLEQAFKKEPDNQTFGLNLANAYVQNDRLKDAAHLLHRLLKNAENKKELYQKLGIVFYKLGRYTQSRKLYQKATHYQNV